MPTTIVITGASTGIGFTCALYLAQRGYQVVAGVRKESDLERLRAYPLTPIFLDVTQPAVLQQAAQTVQEMVGDAGIQGLINNAGVAFPGPLEYVPMPDVDLHFEVNVKGVIAATQAFLPLLRQGKGRIIQMSSMGGRNAVPFFGAYCASKFALEGLSDALRLELRPWGIKVILMEPGAIDTPIWSKSAGASGEMFAHYPTEAQSLYGKWLRYLSKSVPKIKGLPAEQVAQAVEKALTAKRPRTRYVLDNTSRGRALLEMLPVPIRDFLMARQFGLG